MRCNLRVVIMDRQTNVTGLEPATRVIYSSRHASLIEAGKRLRKLILAGKGGHACFVLDVRDGRTWSCNGALTRGIPYGMIRTPSLGKAIDAAMAHFNGEG